MRPPTGVVDYSLHCSEKPVRVVHDSLSGAALCEWILFTRAKARAYQSHDPLSGADLVIPLS